VIGDGEVVTVSNYTLDSPGYNDSVQILTKYTPDRQDKGNVDFYKFLAAFVVTMNPAGATALIMGAGFYATLKYFEHQNQIGNQIGNQRRKRFKFGWV